jgi:hypothetical protein
LLEGSILYHLFQPVQSKTVVYLHGSLSRMGQDKS